MLLPIGLQVAAVKAAEVGKEILLADGENNNTTANTWNASSITGEKGNGFENFSNSIQAGGNSIVYILMMIVGFGLVIGLIVAALKIALGGSATKTDGKGSLLWILVAGIIAFGAMGIVGAIQAVGSGLFTK